jgi:hypothetical protein
MNSWLFSSLTELLQVPAATHDHFNYTANINTSVTFAAAAAAALQELASTQHQVQAGIVKLVEAVQGQIIAQQDVAAIRSRSHSSEVSLPLCNAAAAAAVILPPEYDCSLVLL